VQALDGIDLELRYGTLIGLVGPNGSGKSTFLNVLSGFIRPDEGVVRIGNQDIAGWTPYRIARMGIGRTFQIPQLIDDLTTLENIELGLIGNEPADIAGSLLPLAEARRRAEMRRSKALAAYDAVGLPPEVIGMPASSLSLGMKRVVEVARAMVSAPTLMLIDEPAAGLNDAERDHLGQLLRRLRAGGTSILVVEHNVSFVMRYCDELVLLEDGAVSCRSSLGGALPTKLVDYLNQSASTEMKLAGVA